MYVLTELTSIVVNLSKYITRSASKYLASRASRVTTDRFFEDTDQRSDP